MPNDPLKLASEALTKAIETEKRNRKLLDSIGPAIIQALSPVLNRIESAVSRLKVDIQPKIEVNPVIEIPEISIPEIQVPEVHVPAPIVNYTPPTINIPMMEVPDEMNIKGWVSLMGVSLENPLPVQLRNPDGSPVNLAQTINNVGGGGGHGIVKIGGIPESAWGSVITPDGRLKTEAAGSGGGLTDTELRATSVPVSQVSGSRWSTEASQGGSWVVSQVSGATDSVVVNDVLVTVGVNQVSGANWSVSATQVTSPWVVSATDLDIRDLANATDSISAYQVSGASWSVTVNSIAAGDNNIGNVDVVTMPTVTVTATDLDIRDLVNATDSVSVYQVSGANWSVNVPGSVAVTATDLDIRDLANATDSVSNYQVSGANWSVQTSGISRTTNPTAVADGSNAQTSHDDLGRVLTRPVQVRDLILTSYTTLSNGTETTLLTAAAGTYADCIMLTATNTSSAAIQVNIRAVSGGNIIHTFYLPATTGPVGWAPAVPWPQDATGNAWTADMGDFTNTTVYLSGLFSKEV